MQRLKLLILILIASLRRRENGREGLLAREFTDLLTLY
jgi:hypothetical protein